MGQGCGDIANSQDDPKKHLSFSRKLCLVECKPHHSTFAISSSFEYYKMCDLDDWCEPMLSCTCAIKCECDMLQMHLHAKEYACTNTQLDIGVCVWVMMCVCVCACKGKREKKGKVHLPQ